jgi:hypothetical protein
LHILEHLPPPPASDARGGEEEHMNGYKIFFIYDEDNALLRLEYDADKNEMTITGGKNGYARLANEFMIYSEPECPSGEDTHWHEIVDTDYLFDIERK